MFRTNEKEIEIREIDSDRKEELEDSCPHYDVYENGETNHIQCCNCGKIFRE